MHGTVWQSRTRCLLLAAVLIGCRMPRTPLTRIAVVAFCRCATGGRPRACMLRMTGRRWIASTMRLLTRRCLLSVGRRRTRRTCGRNALWGRFRAHRLRDCFGIFAGFVNRLLRRLNLHAPAAAFANAVNLLGRAKRSLNRRGSGRPSRSLPWLRSVFARTPRRRSLAAARRALRSWLPSRGISRLIGHFAYSAFSLEAALSFSSFMAARMPITPLTM